MLGSEEGEWHSSHDSFAMVFGGTCERIFTGKKLRTIEQNIETNEISGSVAILALVATGVLREKSSKPDGDTRSITQRRKRAGVRQSD